MTFFIYHPGDINTHPSLPGHPERTHRLWAALEGAHQADIGPREFLEAVPRDIGLAEQLHDKSYLDMLTKETSQKDHLTRLDGGDTYLNHSTLNAALCGVGGCYDAIDALMYQRATGAMVMSRPPGHHATRTKAMGFCILGTAALASAYAREMHGLNVAVLDFDLHHFNGTEDLLWNHEDMLLASTHQADIWPMTGSAESRGAHGQILNRPLQSGSGSLEMRRAWSDIFARVRDFEPELIIVSAGFDAHADDPLSGLNWSIDDYRWLGDRIRSLAETTCEGRVLSILEGGYDLSVLKDGVRAYLEGICPDFGQVSTRKAVKASGVPYTAPMSCLKRGRGFACVKEFSRLWIQDQSTGSFVYTAPDFLGITSRKELIGFTEVASRAGEMKISDIIDFEHGLKRRFGYRQRSSSDF